jgi:hypothetical protein
LLALKVEKGIWTKYPSSPPEAECNSSKQGNRDLNPASTWTQLCQWPEWGWKQMTSQSLPTWEAGFQPVRLRGPTSQAH